MFRAAELGSFGCRVQSLGMWGLTGPRALGPLWLGGFGVWGVGALGLGLGGLGLGASGFRGEEAKSSKSL